MYGRIEKRATVYTCFLGGSAARCFKHGRRMDIVWTRAYRLRSSRREPAGRFPAAQETRGSLRRRSAAILEGLEDSRGGLMAERDG
eukprot:15924-Chlamydomonas_euryale.AAC.3